MTRHPQEDCRGQAQHSAAVGASPENSPTPADSGPPGLTSESDTGGESSMSGTASCLTAIFLLSLRNLALGSIT